MQGPKRTFGTTYEQIWPRSSTYWPQGLAVVFTAPLWFWLLLLRNKLPALIPEVSQAVQASLSFNIQPEGSKSPFVRHFEADKPEASEWCDLRRTAWQMTWCDWCSKQLSVNRRRPVQRSQPKIMGEVKIWKREKKRKSTQGRAQGHLCFLWSHLLPPLLHPILKQTPPAFSKRKVESFLLEKRVVCLDCCCLPLVGQPLVAEFKHRKRPLVTGRVADRPGRLAEMLLAFVPFPVCAQPRALTGPDAGPWPRSGNQPSAISGTVLTSPFPGGYWSWSIKMVRDGGWMGREGGTRSAREAYIKNKTPWLIFSLVWKI